MEKAGRQKIQHRTCSHPYGYSNTRWLYIRTVDTKCRRTPMFAPSSQGKQATAKDMATQSNTQHRDVHTQASKHTTHRSCRKRVRTKELANIEVQGLAHHQQQAVVPRQPLRKSAEKFQLREKTNGTSQWSSCPLRETKPSSGTVAVKARLTKHVKLCG